MSNSQKSGSDSDRVKISDERSLTSITDFLERYDPMLRGDETHERSFFIKAVNEDGLVANINNVIVRERYKAISFVKRQDYNIVRFSSDLRKNREDALNSVASSLSDRSLEKKILWVALQYIPLLDVYFKLPSVGNTYRFELRLDDIDPSNDCFTFFNAVEKSDLSSFSEISQYSPLEATFHPINSLREGELDLELVSESIEIECEKRNSASSTSQKSNRAYQYMDWVQINNRNPSFAEKTYVDNIYKDPSSKNIVYITVRTPIDLATYKFPLDYNQNNSVWDLIEIVGQGDLNEIRSGDVYIRPRSNNMNRFCSNLDWSVYVPGPPMQDRFDGSNIVFEKEGEYSDGFSAHRIKNNGKYIPIGVDLDYQWNLYVENSEFEKEKTDTTDKNSQMMNENQQKGGLKQYITSIL